MALIQIRDVPDDVYESIRRRARQAGQSIQAYMLARTIEFGRRPTPSEIVAVLDEDLRNRAPLAIDSDALLADLRADRDADRP